MNKAIYDYAKTIKERIGKLNKVLEVGSLNVNGSIKPLFSDAKQYVGIDLESGKDVDIVASSYQIPELFKKESFDCVICCETLEHDAYPWITIRNMRWVLKQGGWMIITAPSLQQHIHHYPKDYWRFLPDAFELVFFKDFALTEGIVMFPSVITNPDPGKDLLTIAMFGQKPKGWKETLPF